MSIADYDEQFAGVYDTLYETRDVRQEARFAAELLDLDNGRVDEPHILDFGCGTGAHAIAFAQTGIAVTGFDTSDAMIDRARAKRPAAESAPIHFATGAFADFCQQLNGIRFDGAVSFFNVFNCMASPDAIVSHLMLLRSRLAVGAGLLIDVWNGAAVLVDGPRPGVRHYPVETVPGREIVRITVPDLDRINQVCTLRYRVLTLDRATDRFTEFESVHTLRFLTPVQYRHLFQLAGLTLVDEFPKTCPGTPITEHDWYISYLLRRDS